MKEVVARAMSMVPWFRKMVAEHIPLWYGLGTQARADMTSA